MKNTTRLSFGALLITGPVNIASVIGLFVFFSDMKVAAHVTPSSKIIVRV